jgi:hypothetical protein
MGFTVWLARQRAAAKVQQERANQARYRSNMASLDAKAAAEAAPVAAVKPAEPVKPTKAVVAKVAKPRAPKIEVRTYKNTKDFAHDAKRRARGGWTLQGQSADGGHLNVGRILLVGIAAPLVGGFRTSGTLTATWMKA